MLRNDVQVALNDVLVQAEHTAHHYRHSATVCETAHPELVGQFNRLAADRESQAEQVRFQLRSLQDLPATADYEWDTLQEFGESLAARLTASGVAALLRERSLDEDRLAALATAALDQPVPGAARDLLDHIRRSARAAVTELDSARQSL